MNVPPIELTDGRVRLRPYTPQHAADIYAAIRESIPELCQFMPWCHADYALTESERWLAGRRDAWTNGAEYDFAIEDAETGQFFGGCGINKINRINRYCNLGYWVRTGAAGRGIATAAARLLIPFAFDTLGLQRIEIVAAIDNFGSQRVAQKVGAVREGVLRQTLFLHGNPRDAIMHSVLPSDLPSPEATS